MSARTSSTIERTASLAILNIAQHAVDHGLTISSIDVPLPCQIDQGLLVRVFRTSLDAWLDSIEVDGEPAIDTSLQPGLEVVTYRGRVPSPLGEIRVSIMALRETPEPCLRLVGPSEIGAAS